MPTYEYICKAHEDHEIVEEFQQYDDPPPRCPQCNVIMERMMSRVAMNFVGPGFYVNDSNDKESTIK